MKISSALDYLIMRKPVRAHSESLLDRQQKAQEIVATFQTPYRGKKKMGKLGLPMELVQQIIEYVCDSYEPRGIRIMAVVIEDLVNAAIASPDFLAVLPHAYEYLGAKSDMSRPTLPATRDWGRLIRDPLSFDYYTLREALKDLLIKQSPSLYGSKAGEALYSRIMVKYVECIIGLLAHFGLKHPSGVPPNLITQLQANRTEHPSILTGFELLGYNTLEFPTYIDKCRLLCKKFKTANEFMRECLRISRLIYRECLENSNKEKNKKMKEENKKIKENNKKILLQFAHHFCLKESCDNAKGPTCSMGRCGKCCTGPCQFHKK